MEVENDPVTQRRESENLPWVEKYRPKKMDDISSHEEAVRTLKKSIQEGNLPHLLLYGPPGTGKTSVILALAHELFGPEMRNRVLELNASDERGIDVIRNKVILFAQQSVKKSIPGYPSPPYKIIIMDEADSLTMDAQSALRRVMEMYSKVTRFCFICNYISKIIPALSSRCARFEFGALPRENVVARLRFISEEEKMTVEDDALQYIYDQSKGDLRSGIHLLQNSYMIFQKDVITKEKLHGITMEIPPMVVKNLWDTIVATTAASSITRLSAAVEKVILDGYPLSILLSLLTSYVVNNTELEDEKKAEICLELARADKAVCDGCDEELLLLGTCCTLVKLL
ncbi:replication factor C subunit [Blastocystis sp. subtype 4]|uniref:replication factor C subunit n=1 Tax=Blastocystis sp. subtype 4 TaxID=944170 RepID=UPI000711D0A9|nr:replication factor C subunit [Blastocystis sp. subtype 4]KNB44092.1 replication factor C subunit [Blastocystis sp. subtype 4]|eukprot:XP_014527535.1 replication factor C subunit [Blastocystis sp. subtype 4]